MNKGDLVIVPFPYTDLSASKSRPALVIWSDKRGEDLILLAITSQINSGIAVDNNCLSKGQLPKKSYIKLKQGCNSKKRYC